MQLPQIQTSLDPLDRGQSLSPTLDMITSIELTVPTVSVLFTTSRTESKTLDMNTTMENDRAYHGALQSL